MGFLETVFVIDIANKRIDREYETYSHFYRKANQTEIDSFHRYLDSIGYYYDEDAHNVLLKRITDKGELKKRLKHYIKDHSFSCHTDEKLCLLDAIERLL